MLNKKHISCNYLINGIDFELDRIEVCCFRCHKGGGNIFLAPVENGKSNLLLQPIADSSLPSDCSHFQDAAQKNSLKHPSYRENFLGHINFDLFEKSRETLLNENKNDKINPKCEGCFNLKTLDLSNVDKRIKYIHFNHWTYCDSDCIYCYTNADKKYQNARQHYNALPLLKEIIDRYGFSPDGEITFAGGEPVLLNEFEDILQYLLEIGAKNIIVHSSGVKYSKVLETGIKENKVKLVISQDSGNYDLYKMIKQTDNFNTVWSNTKQYAKAQQSENINVYSKYVIIPGINDNRKSIEEWLKKVQDAGVKTVIIDIEHKYYEKNKNNFKIAKHLLTLCECINYRAKLSGINIELYNCAEYLYKRYKLLVPFIRNKHYFIELLILACPLLIGNLGNTLIGATDILVVAKYNISSLAAISIANSILFTIFIFGIGILNAISIILSNKRGSKQKIKKYLFSSLTFSIILAFVFTLICYSTIFIIDKLSFEAALIPYIKEYIKIVSFSMFGMFIYQGIKEFLLAYEIVNFPNMILLAAVIINLIFDIIFVFGFGPIPSMGSKGAAIATFGVRTIMGLVMFVYIFKALKLKDKLDFSFMGHILRIGYPIGAALLLEFLAFNIITIMAGREAGILAATHNILSTVSSSSFMVPLALSTAVAIKVAYYYGAKKCNEIKKYSYAGIIMGVSFMTFFSILLVLFPSQIIRLFTDNQDVLNIALPIVIVAAMFQVFDGFQVIAGGILKGFKMTKVVSSCVLFGYWLIGMPVAYFLVFKHNYSLKGYWIAIAVSIFAMGVIQASIAKWKFMQVKKIYQK